MWGGIECTVNRVGDEFHDQLERNGHGARRDDLERFAGLGLRAIRYPVLWERTAPEGLATADWSWADERLEALRELGIEPIVGLVHHGSGPRHTSLLSEDFAPGLASFAGAVARRFPWVQSWTPVNEPLTTARFSALYGIWHPHARDDASFVRVLLNQCRATVLAMAAIREANPAAKLIQTDDLSKTYGTDGLSKTIEFYNHRRWLSWDLLCGMVDSSHPLWDYLVESGAAPVELRWFVENPCPPDIIGVNYYVTGERWLEPRSDQAALAPSRLGSEPAAGFDDVEAVRRLASPVLGVGPLLEEVWRRYGLPIAVTEAHLDAKREDQMRWLFEVWRGAENAREGGVDVRAVTAWSLLGSFDWNCLVRARKGYYEPGTFDLRAPLPRSTALATLVRELAAGTTPSHPVLHGEGWWRRPQRFAGRPVRIQTVVTPLDLYRQGANLPARPIVISGATGTLGRAFGRICEQRNLTFQLLNRDAMDIADADSIEVALARWKPWAVINASGYCRIDTAEVEPDRCFRENTLGPAALAAACAQAGVRMVTFSSDQVFDGCRSIPWLESDAPAPLNTYGRNKLSAEREVLARHAGALVIRTSAFFGPLDGHNFVTQALNALERGHQFRAADDVRFSPTYLPDLVNTCLDLLIDGEVGIWHLVNQGDVSWAELARQAAEHAGVQSTALRHCSSAQLGLKGARPVYAVLGSERAHLMPSLEDALARFAVSRAMEQVSGDVVSKSS